MKGVLKWGQRVEVARRQTPYQLSPAGLEAVQ